MMGRRGIGAALLLSGALVWMGCDSSPTENRTEPTISLDFEGSSLGSSGSTGRDSLAFFLRDDTNARTRLWYSFQVNGGSGRSVRFRLMDGLSVADDAFWSIKRPVASSDGGSTWTRIADTSAEGGTYEFRYTPGSDADLIAAALPYNFSRWTRLVESLRPDPWVQSVTTIGSSLDGNPVDMLEITDASVSAAEKTGIWVVARQHPGEPEGSFMLEGFLTWLLGDDAEAGELRRRAEVFVVGFLNPDGVLAGNQRVNRAGLDLNRQWAAPTLSASPTIAAVTEEILGYAAGGGTVRIVVDFHAAPGGRSNFFFYNDEATSSPELFAEVQDLLEAATRVNPDFIPIEGSTARPVPNGERARNLAFDRLGTHGVTVEASSNDVTYGPFQGQWATEARLWALGEAVGVSVAEVLYGIGVGAGVAAAAAR